MQSNDTTNYSNFSTLNKSTILLFCTGIDLREFLWEKAKRTTAARNPFYYLTSESIDYKLINVELSSECSIVDNIKLPKKRKEIIFQPQRGNLSISDIFPSKELQNQSRITYIVGAQGMGKTSIAKCFLKEIINKYSDQVEYVFFLECCYINFEKKTNLLQFLAPFLPFCWILEESVVKEVLKNLLKNNKVVIFIDDLQLARKHFSSAIQEISLDDKYTPGIFIQNFLSANPIFQEAEVVATCTPFCFCNPKFRFVNILGMTTTSMQDMCDNICGKNSSKILQFINCFPFVKDFCSVPINCAFVMFAANAISSKQTPGFGIPLTRIVMQAFTLILRSKNLKLNEDALKDLSKIAWDRIKNSNSAENVTETDIPKDCSLNIISTFFKIFMFRKNQDFETVRKFHFLWLELLAAIYWVLIMDPNDFKNILDVASKDHNGSLWFVAMHVGGLFNEDSLENMEEFLSSFQVEYEIFADKMTTITDIVKKLFKLNAESFTSFLFACSLSHSMQFEELTIACASDLDERIFISGDIYPSDVAGIYHVLQARKKPYFIYVCPSTTFIYDSFQIFMQALQVLSKLEVIKVFILF